MARSTLSFSARISVGVEAGRLLHRDQREQLQQVVLQHVAGGAGGVVEAGPGADADVLGHGDLHRVDVLGVPHRLEQGVGEAQRQDVLDRLLAQVVVDAEDVLRGEHVVDQVVELLGRGQVVAERLLHHDPPPAAGLVVVGHAGALQLLEHGRERRRRDGQVERGVAGDAVGVAQLVQGARRACRRRRRRRTSPPTNVMLPASRAQTSSRHGVRACSWARLAGQRLEVAVAPVAAGEAEHHEAGRQQAPVGQVVDGRDELLAGQVAGDAEDDQRARLRDPRQPPVLRVPQRVAPLRRARRRSRSSPSERVCGRVQQLGDARGPVGQVQVQQRAAPPGQRLPVAGGLRRLQLRRRCTACPAPRGPRRPRR